jgi:hypothetical protein
MMAAYITSQIAPTSYLSQLWGQVIIFLVQIVISLVP